MARVRIDGEVPGLVVTFGEIMFLTRPQHGMYAGFCQVIAFGQLSLRIAGGEAPATKFAVFCLDIHIAHMDVKGAPLFGDLRRVEPGERYGEGVTHSCRILGFLRFSQVVRCGKS